MNWNEYVDLAMRTEIKRTPMNGLLHAALGLSSELGEIVNATGPENLREELGDCFWYCAVAWSALDEKPPVVVPSREGLRPCLVSGTQSDFEAMKPRVFENHVSRVSEFVDLIKKSFAYGRTPSGSELCSAVNRIIDQLFILAAISNLEPSECMERNIAKLRKRFPDGFTQERALNRNLNAEGEALR